jgi:HPt (histidine-containing phosphotransfer) domain-containing protein
MRDFKSGEPDVLNSAQLLEVAMHDQAMAREVLHLLVKDTSEHLPDLAAAIRGGDAESAARLAHYSRGACASAGALAAAATLGSIEGHARSKDFEGCAQSLDRLSSELKRLREAVESF